jgi:ATP-dependent Clp protease protease subunit
MRINNRSPFRPGAGFYRIENKAEETTVYLYDEINSYWGISAQDFVKDLNGITSGTIHLRVNSPGGSVFEGTAIFNAIRQHKAKVIAHIDGLAASIASVIIMAADEIRMGNNAYLMIHEPWSIMAGSADDLRKEADLLDKVGETIAQTYVNRTGKNLDEVKKLMAAETWFTAEEALENGLIDQIVTEKNAKAQAGLFDLSIYGNVPEELLNDKKSSPTAKDLEHALRNAGCSTKQAKAILSKGLADDLRDVDPPEPPAEPVQEPRDVVLDVPRDVVQPVAKKDRTVDLLTRAEMLAPTKNY